MYLRMHPLFIGTSLEDLDIASDMLKLSFYPPGTQLYPHRCDHGGFCGLVRLGVNESL